MPDAVCAVLCSWWWTENPSETCRASYRNKSIWETLHLVGYTPRIIVQVLVYNLNWHLSFTHIYLLICSICFIYLYTYVLYVLFNNHVCSWDYKCIIMKINSPQCTPWDICSTGFTGPCIINLDTRKMWVVRLTPRPIYGSWYPMNRRLYGSRTGTRPFVGGTKLCPFWACRMHCPQRRTYTDCAIPDSHTIMAK